MELTNEQLEEMVVGKPMPPSAVFFEKAALDVEESKRQGRRVYKPTLYIKLKAAGVTDSVSYKATKQDIFEHPEAYEHFQSQRQGYRRTVPVSIIPNLDITHMQELIDMGFSTVQSLAAAEQVPPHLEYAQKSAIMLNQVLEDQQNADQKESIKESGSEIGQAPPLPPTGRRDHPVGVDGRNAAPGERRADVEGSEGNEKAGRFNGDPSVNWSYEFHL